MMSQTLMHPLSNLKDSEVPVFPYPTPFPSLTSMKLQFHTYQFLPSKYTYHVCITRQTLVCFFSVYF